MKIGLLTYHHSKNYGAVLQTYATCRILKELGHDVEIINIRQLEKKKLRHIVFYKKDRDFTNFMSKFYPPETSLIESYEQLKKIKFKYDCLLVGSDQVWNPSISLDKCMAYYLDFGDSNILRISYASSLGISEWPKKFENLKPMVAKALSKFNSISVRENTGKQLLKTEFGIDSNVVLDPTMLHSSYPEINNKIPETNNIVCYLLNRTKEQLDTVRLISKTLNLSAQIITSVYPIPGMKYTYPPSIENWIKYIGGAKLVITDSFHGLVFSLLYQRNFVVVAVNNGRNSRLLDLLQMVGLKNRYFLSLDELKNSSVLYDQIDYTNVNKIIQEKRIDSINFLKNALK